MCGILLQLTEACDSVKVSPVRKVLQIYSTIGMVYRYCSGHVPLSKTSQHVSTSMATWWRAVLALEADVAADNYSDERTRHLDCYRFQRVRHIGMLQSLGLHVLT